MATLVLLVHRRNPISDRAGLIDSLILSLGIGLLSWVFLIALYIQDLERHDQDLAKGRVDGLPARRRAAARRGDPPRGRHRPTRSRPSCLLASRGRHTVLLVTDSVYNYMLLKGTYHHQVLLGRGLDLVSTSCGAPRRFAPTMRTLEEPADRRARLARRGPGAAGRCSSVDRARDPGSPRPTAPPRCSSSASRVDGAVPAGRRAHMAGLVRQEERVVARERALRHAGLALVVRDRALKRSTAQPSRPYRSLVGRAVAVDGHQTSKRRAACIVASSDGPTEPSGSDVLTTRLGRPPGRIGLGPAQRSARRSSEAPWESPRATAVDADDRARALTALGPGRCARVRRGGRRPG